MLDVEVIDDPAAAMTTLDPKRARLLAEMAEPISAATLAARVGLARQKVNYHLRALEKHGLVEEAEQRRWGGLTERAACKTLGVARLGAQVLLVNIVLPGSRPRMRGGRTGGDPRGGNQGVRGFPHRALETPVGD